MWKSSHNTLFNYRRRSLNIHQNKEEKSLKEDPLVTWLIEVKAFGRKNSTMLIGVVIAIIIVAAGATIFNQIQKSAAGKASEAFGSAMIAYNSHDYVKAVELFKNVTDNYRSTVQGIQSAYMLGAISYEQEKFDEAITWYTVASQGSEKADFIAGEALEAIALCYEAKGDVTSAVSYLEKALKDDKVKFRHTAIKWKLALLIKGTDVNRAKILCNEIASDTLAKEFHQKAENLVAAIEAGSAGQ
jgi:hypothetical protein